MKPTEEQQYAIELAKSGRSFALEALAGTGKSTTLKMIANAVSPRRRILYTAFNASVINDAKAGGFPSNVRITSNHGLAYGAFGVAYRNAGRMERRLTPRVIADYFNLDRQNFPGDLRADEVAYLALDAVLRFQQDASRELSLRHVHVPGSIKADGARGAAFTLARAIWQQMCDDKSSLPVTHDTYLKRWALTEPRINADLILNDEAQDANGVVIEVLAKQKHAQIIVVGDARQAIYSWRGAVNAMQSFPVEERAFLTQSFRFGDRIAQAANAVLNAHAQAGVEVRGTPSISDRIGAFDTRGQYTVIARTNAALIGELVNETGRVGIVGGVTDMLRLVEGAEKLQRGERALTVPDLMDFRNWAEVEQYANTQAGRDLSVLVKLVDAYGTYRLTDMLRRCEGNEKDESRCAVILTTAHKSKGREWNHVVLLDDFPAPTDHDLAGEPNPDGETSKWTPEEANLLYVAITRGKQVVNIENVEAWRDAVNRCIRDGVELPGITDDVRFNKELEYTDPPEEGEDEDADGEAPCAEQVGEWSDEAQDLAGGVLRLLFNALRTDLDARRKAGVLEAAREGMRRLGIDPDDASTEALDQQLRAYTA